MNKNSLRESLQFLIVCRETLCHVVDMSSHTDNQKRDTKNFLRNEASDYQIMSLIVRGELPDQKYNIVDELLIFDELKDTLADNASIVAKVLDENTFVTFLTEVDSVYPYGSSAKPILEYFSENGYNFQEAVTPTDIIRGLRKFGKAVQATPEKIKAAADAAAKKYDNAKDAVRATYNQLSKETDPALDRMRQQKGGFGKQALSGKQQDALAQTMRKNDAALSRMQAQKGGLGAGVKDLSKDQQANIGKSTKGGVSVDQMIAKAKGAYNSASQAVKDAAGKAQQFAGTDQGKAIGAAALAALALYASYKVYKRFFSQSAKACRGKSGPERNQCLADFKKKALMAQIKDLQSATAGCSKTKNPAKCKAAIDKKIANLKMKIAKVK
jgi:Arc/MetJ-type ribon-helix-helix transcriptional regulator